MAQTAHAAQAPEQSERSLEVVRGVVEATNDTGFRMTGRWYNYSRFAAVPRPEVGQAVEVALKGRFVTGLKLAGGAAVAAPPDSSAPTLRLDGRSGAPVVAEAAIRAGGPDVPGPASDGTRPDSGWAGTAAWAVPPEQPGATPTGSGRERSLVASSPAGRDAGLTRLAVLKAAAAFLAHRPDAVPDDVLSVAIQWLVWVEEDDHAPAA